MTLKDLANFLAANPGVMIQAECTQGGRMLVRVFRPGAPPLESSGRDLEMMLASVVATIGGKRGA